MRTLFFSFVLFCVSHLMYGQARKSIYIYFDENSSYTYYAGQDDPLPPKNQKKYKELYNKLKRMYTGDVYRKLIEKENIIEFYVQNKLFVYDSKKMKKRIITPDELSNFCFSRIEIIETILNSKQKRVYRNGWNKYFQIYIVDFTNRRKITLYEVLRKTPSEIP